MISKDFIVAMNYAYKYGSYNPKTDEEKAYKEFGEIADRKLKQAYGIEPRFIDVGDSEHIDFVELPEEENVNSSIIL